MSNTRRRLDRMAEIEQRNQNRLATFKAAAEDPETEHKRSRLAEIEGYKRDKPGCEGVREQIIARYRHELGLDKEN